MKAYQADFPHLIGRSHRPYTSVEIISGTSTPPPLLVIAGSYTHSRLADSHSSFRATVVDPTGQTSLTAASNLILPFVHEVAIYKGVRYPNLAEPIFFLQGVYRITDSNASERQGQVTIELEGMDRSERIRRPLAAAVSYPAGMYWDMAMRSLIRAQFPGAEFTANWPAEDPNMTVPGRMKAPAISVDKTGDAWAKCKEGASNIGKELLLTPEGLFDLVEIPDVNVGTSVWTYAHGRDAGHVDTSKSYRGEDIFNGVIVEGTNGAHGEAWDDTNAPFSRPNIGPRPLTIQRNVTDQLQADAAARTELTRRLAGAEKVVFTALVNAALETGDLITYRHPRLGIDGNYIVNEITGPLGLTSLMSVTVAKY